MVVHKTDRASLVGNVIWDNGQVSRDSRCIFPLLDKYFPFDGPSRIRIAYDNQMAEKEILWHVQGDNSLW